MPLFEMSADSFRPIAQASLAELKVRERGDLQRLLRTQIDVLGDDLYVLEEFGDWEDSRRCIDLLAIDLQANLVVVELKRTGDGGHMELQAIRYASMVSAITFERAERIHGSFLTSIGVPPDEARRRMLKFLDWEEPNEESFAADVRIVLVSEGFSRELTTAVLWLRERDLDIRCIRLRPYQDGSKVMIDVQQLIPLPEANDYQVQLREKEQVGRKQRADAIGDLINYWEGVVGIAHSRKTRHANIKPGAQHWLGASSGVRGLAFNYTVVQDDGAVELYIDRGEAMENKRIFDRFYDDKTPIESAFGDSLSWERLDTKQGCRIKRTILGGGYKSAPDTWPIIQARMVDAMTKLEAALRPTLDSLGL